VLFQGSQLVPHGRVDAGRGIDWSRFGPGGCDVEDFPGLGRRTSAGAPVLIAASSCVAAGSDSARAAGVRIPVEQGPWRLAVIENVTRCSPGIWSDQPSTATSGQRSCLIVGRVDLPGGGMRSRLDD
jgi:hypothetical protein